MIKKLSKLNLLWIGFATTTTTTTNNNFFVEGQSHYHDGERHPLEDSMEFEWNSVHMPYPVSDTTSNYMEGENGDGTDGFIIITGGCDDPLGNQRNKTEALKEINLDFFYCTSVTGKTLKFDPFENTFTAMENAPEQRYRHAAAVYNGELYVIGGRDAMDNLVKEISSFNPKTNTWTKRGKLPDNIVTSDLAAWTHRNYIYVAGGFDADYNAVGNTYRLDLTGGNVVDFESMKYEERTPMKVPRGDMHAVTMWGKAYLAGGITHENEWCVGMRDTEVYDMGDDTWERWSSLTYGRADMAVSVLNGKIFASGGESKPDRCAELGDPAFGSIPEDHVEVTKPEPESSHAHWYVIGKIKDERFRFSAATVPALNRIYHFGGQLPFDFDCQCFRADDKVGYMTELFIPETNDTNLDTTLSAGAITSIIIASLVGVGIVSLLILKVFSKKSIPSDAVV